MHNIFYKIDMSMDVLQTL